jgi:eukaryotic-like serine/threonine-protein kinase
VSERPILDNRYRIDARIGRGGMGEVYRAYDPVLDRTVAIKCILPQFAPDAAFMNRFRREARAAARLNDSNIVAVYDSRLDADPPYMVMEYVEGRTIADFLSTGRHVNPFQATELTQRVATALSAAHVRGIIHRDIKPLNIMITREGVVKVMDFGIARLEIDQTVPDPSHPIGSVLYMSPEQARGQPVDSRSDIYSLGCTYHELLTGRPPFTADDTESILYMHVHEPPVAPSRRDANVPKSVDAIVLRCLAKEPGDRYPTANDLVFDLERARGTFPREKRIEPRARLVLNEKGYERVVPLAPVGFTTIGRGPHCNVWLSDAYVSSLHAHIGFIGESWVIADLGSTNGTALNGRRVGSEDTSLKNGDKITVGRIQLIFRSD